MPARSFPPPPIPGKGVQLLRLRALYHPGSQAIARWKLVDAMKKTTILLLLFVISFTVQADEYEEFRKLPPEEQIEEIILKFRYNYYDYMLGNYINILLENPEVVKPLLFDRFRKVYPPRHHNAGGDDTFMILDNILFSMCQV
jgi:hypothetical protein